MSKLTHKCVCLVKLHVQPSRIPYPINPSVFLMIVVTEFARIGEANKKLKTNRNVNHDPDLEMV